MSILDSFFNQEAQQKQRERGTRSNSDIKVTQAQKEFDALVANPALARKYFGDDDIMPQEQQAAYSAAFQKAWNSPYEIKASPGMPGYNEQRRIKAARDEVAMSKAFMEAVRGY